MSAVAKEIRKISMVIFDRFTRSSSDPNEARLLADASKLIPKDRRVVIVDSDLAYGNARALAEDLSKTLDDDELLFLAYDESGLRWATARGIPAQKFSSKASEDASVLWDKLIRAKVSVYDTHNWWRTQDQLLQRSLLEGSHKIQLWHGATGPVGKVFGLERLDTAATFWHFSAVATSSVGFDQLVNEPNQAEYRRTRSMLAAESIHDVEYRVVSALNSGTWTKPSKVRVLIAPTYSESIAGEDALVDWIGKLANTASRFGWECDVAMHPGAKPRVMKQIKKLKGITLLENGVSTSTLRNYSAVVTDFSGIAHDALMCGVPTISVLIDFENYQSHCPAIVDEDQMKVAYVVRNPSELESQIKLAIESDPRCTSREIYIEEIVSSLGAIPGANTRDSVIRALDS
jgi:hypothetical protein